MLDGFSKREILFAIGSVVIILVLGSFGGVYLAKSLLGERPDEPLERAGGLKSVQEIQIK